MDRLEKYETARRVLEKFDYDGKRYDARYWANFYGCAINAWDTECITKRKDDPRFYEVIDPFLKKAFNFMLNQCAN